MFNRLDVTLYFCRTFLLRSNEGKVFVSIFLGLTKKSLCLSGQTFGLGVVG